VKRVKREFYGVVARIPPQKPGALAQCAFCEWGRFFPDRKRKRYSALARAAASLRAHARKVHRDKFVRFSTAEEMFG
jgi:hypothetical protein